jgi:hypothetical protein
MLENIFKREYTTAILTETFLTKRHYTDDFLCSPYLCISKADGKRFLKEKALFACETVKAGRKDWPCDLESNRSGEYRELHHECVVALVLRYS